MRTRAALLLLVGLAACNSSRPIPPAHRAEPVTPPAAIDGRYIGIARLIRADTPGCPRSGPRVITVANGTLTLQYRGTPRTSYDLSATVSPDGAIHGSDGRGTIDGQISGDHMDLTVTSPICDLRYALNRV